MSSLFFTREQAEMICYQYQSLVGMPCNNDIRNTGTIECVTVAPFDNLNKWFFIYLYEESGEPEASLSFYESAQYDVILISRINGEITFKDLRSYLAANHIKSDLAYFSMPVLSKEPNSFAERNQESWYR